MRAIRRVATFVVIAFALTVGIPSNVVRPGGEFPLSWLWSWAQDVPAAATLGIVPQTRGVTPAGHHVPSADTKAGGGSGRAPDRVKGGLPAYMPYEPKTPPGSAGKAVTGFNAANSKWDGSKATAASDVHSNADGSVTQRIWDGRRNFKGADGVWRPIDTTLRVRPDGRLHMTANSLQVSVARGGGDSSLVSMTLPTGEVFAYDLRGATIGKPSIVDSTATYQDVLAHTDLELITSTTGVKETLILRSADAPREWLFPLQLTGLTPRLTNDGEVELVDKAGKVAARIPRGVMQDSNVDTRNGAPAESTAVKYELVDGALKVTADEAWLRDPARKYPVRVDPTAVTADTHDVFADNDSSTWGDGDNLPVGTWNGGANKSRSFLWFNNFRNDLFGRRITGAKLHLWLTWHSACDVYRPFWVHPITSQWTVESVAAGSFPGPNIGGAIGSKTVDNGRPACLNTDGIRSLGQEVVVDLSTQTFDNWVRETAPNYGLALTASETDNYAWKRFTSANYASGNYAPYVELTYADNVPPQLDVRYPGNNHVATTLTPQLVARGHDPDNWPGKGLQYRYYVYEQTGQNIIADSGAINETSWTVPAGKLSWGKSYLYTVQAVDYAHYSAAYPLYSFSTPVPQPVLSSRLTQNTHKGFDPSIGNYTTSATDVSIDTVGPALALNRSYNSLDLRTQASLGRGWSSIVDSRVTEAGDIVVVTYPDGQDIAFGKEANGTFTPPSGRFATFTTLTGGGYKLTDKNATVYQFSQAGGAGVYKISSITDANGRALTFSYNAQGQTEKMTSASGRALNFTWGTPAGGNYAHVLSVATDGPANTWTYTYNNDNLVKVCAPTSDIYCAQYEYTWLSQYSNAVLNHAPFSYWRLNETAGATVAASSVLNNAGVDNALYSNVGLGSVSTLDGSTSKAATFNGTSSYVQLPGKLITDGSYQSISMWFKTTQVNGVLFSYNLDPISKGTSNWNLTPALYIGSDGKLRGEFWQGYAQPITSAAAVNDDTWHHVVLSGAGDTQTMYVDGFSQGSLSGTIQPIPEGSANVYLGAGFIAGTWPGHATSGTWPAPAYYFNGAIAEVAFFNRALSGGTASDLHNIGKWPRSALTKVVRPSGSVTAAVDYDKVTAKVGKVTDENGGTWTLGKPTVAGNSGVYAASVLGGRPDDYWRLGDVAGHTDAVNEVAGGTATYHGAVTLGSGGPFPDAKAAKFDGSSSYLELPVADVPTTGATTIGMWFQMPSGSTAGGVLYSYQAAPMTDLNVEGNWTPTIYVGTDGKLRGGLWNTWGGGGQVVTPGTVNDGQWHHVVLAAGSDGQALYLDGNEVGKSDKALVTTNAAHAYVGTGKWQNWPGSSSTVGYFPGSISDFAYYTTKLSAQQAQAQFVAAKQAVPVAITKVASSVEAIPMPVSTVEVTDPGGQKQKYSFDLLRGNRMVAQTDTLGNTTKVGYDVGGYSNLSYDPNGVLTETISDVRGNTIQSITCQDQAANKCSSVYYTYFPDATTATLTPDPRNDVMLTMRDGRSASATDNTYLTKYTYDVRGNQYEAEDALKRKTVTSYSDGTTVGGYQGAIVPAGLPIILTSPGGKTERRIYYANGDLYEMTDATGKITRFVYDALGRVVTQTEITSTFPNGIVTAYVYDAAGRVVTQTEQAVTNRVTGAVHTSVTETKYNVDGLAELQKVSDTTGGDASREIKTEFNGYGQVLSETDATGKKATFEYDAYGKVVKEFEPDGGVTRNTYDAEGNLLKSETLGYTGDPDSPTAPVDVVTTAKAYDPAGRLARETDAMGRTTAYAYTDNGLLAKVTSTDGTKSFVSEQNVYDAAGNVVKKTTGNGATVVNYIYDAVNHQIESTIDTHSVFTSMSVRKNVRSYSADDELIAERDLDWEGRATRRTENAYDDKGNPISQTAYPKDVDGLVPTGRWKLNQNGTDASGNNPLSPQGTVSWSADRGGAATFTGSGRLVSAGPAIDNAASFTVAAWINLADNTVLRRAVAANGVKTSAFDLRYQQSTNKWMFATKNADIDNASGASASSTSAPALNTWTHLAGVYDATTGKISLYVNGVLESTTTAGKPFTATGPLWIGAGWYNSKVSDQWKGGVSDVQVFGKALTAGDIDKVKAGTVTEGVVRTSVNRDQDGLALSAVDSMGRVTNYSYDEEGRVTQITAPAVLAEKDGAASVSTRPVTRVGYDTFGNATERQDANGNLVVTNYDAVGRAVRVKLPSYTPPGSATPIQPETTTVYDVMGQVVQTTDPLSKVTSYTYDQMGRVTKTVAPNAAVTRAGYDLAGNVVSTMDANGAVAKVTYDGLGRKDSSTQVVRQNSAEYRTAYRYHDVGGGLAEVTSPSGVKTSMTYNGAGELASQTDGAGLKISYFYDEVGRLYWTDRPDGSWSTNTYDGADRLLTTNAYDNGGIRQTTQSNVYNAAGQVVGATDARGNTTTTAYDALGRVTTHTQPVSASESIATSFGYDAAGNRTRFTDGRGNSFITTYNTLGLPESQLEPVTTAHSGLADRTFTVAYDAAGRPVKQTQPGEVGVDYTYDVAGNLVKQAGTGADAVTADKTFGYDLGGRMVSASGNTLSYDDRGLLLATTGPSGDSSFKYDGDARMTERKDAAGTTAYGYDTAGRLSTVRNGTFKQTVTYNGNSQVDKIVHGDNGNVRQFGYDGLYRTVSDEVKTAAGTSLGKIAYGYDANSNMVSKTTTGVAGAAANTYTYDWADRLTSWNGTAYQYDKSGNRTQAGSKAFTYDERNRLLGGGGVSYTYSPRGNLRFAVNGGDSQETKTDAFGQVAQQGTQSYTYDGFGRAIRAGFAYTGVGNDLASDGTATYLRDPGGALAGVGSVYAWTDLHTDVVGQFTAAGSTLAGSATYDPLGKVLNTSGMTGNLGYQSEWTDGLTGRVNMHARWYNTETGQFDNRDTANNSPLPRSINANRYQYGDGNPMTTTDPTGHWGCGWCSKAWNATKSAVSSAWNTVSNYVEEKYERARNYVRQAVSYVQEKVQQVSNYVQKKWQQTTSYVQKKYNQAKSYVTKKYNEGRKYVAQKYNQAKTAVKAAVKQVKQAGHAVYEYHARVAKQVAYSIKDAYSKSVTWVKEHKAEITGALVGAVVGIGCGVAIGWTGVGAVACGALAGAAGSLVTGAMKGHTGWELVGDAVFGGTIGAVTGGLGSVLGSAIGSGIRGLANGFTGALGSGARSVAGSALGGAARGFASGAVREAGSIASGRLAGGLLSNSGSRAGAARAGDGLLSRAKNALGMGCKHSFDPKTRVRMADGTAKAIGTIVLGDKVLATDPVSNRSEAKPVTALHVNLDTELSDVTVRNGKKGTTVTLKTTQHHPFWDVATGQWVNAADLQPGRSTLTGPDGQISAVVAVRNFIRAQTMRDLTVEGIHTYYVLADEDPLLVHNCDVHDLARAESAKSTTNNTAGAVARDTYTGEWAYGESGMVPSQIHPQLQSRLDELTRVHGGSLESWPAGECAEFNACNNLLFKMPKVRLDEIEYATIVRVTGLNFPSCDNCRFLLGGGGAIERTS